DREDAIEIGMSLNHILGRLVTDVLQATAVNLRDDRDLTRVTTGVVSGEDFLEAFGAKLARLDDREIEDGNLASLVPERLNHRLSRLSSTLVIVGGDVTDHICVFHQTLDVRSENRDSRHHWLP